MAKQITITAVCDNDTVHRGQQVPASHEHVLGVDGTDRQIDLCDSCETNVLNRIIVDLWDHGASVLDHAPRKASRDRGKGLPTMCPIDGKTSKSRAGLGQHLKQHHSQSFHNFPGGLKTVADYEGLAYGPTDR